MIKNKKNQINILLRSTAANQKVQSKQSTISRYNQLRYLHHTQTKNRHNRQHFNIKRQTKSLNHYNFNKYNIINSYNLTHEQSFQNLSNNQQKIKWIPTKYFTIPLMPNPQCLGCVKFFYRNTPYNFTTSCNKYFILSYESAINREILRKILLSMVQYSKESYVIISDKIIREEQIFLKGIAFKDKIQYFVKYVIQIIRQITYKIGQKILNMKHFQVSILPVLQKGYVQTLNQAAFIGKYFGYFAIRIKFNPTKFEPHNIGDWIAAGKQFSDRHQQILCQKPFSFNFISSFDRNQVQIQKWIELYQEKRSQYTHITVLKIPCSRYEKLIQSLKCGLISTKLKFQLFKPFGKQLFSQEYENNIWVLYHSCSHQQIFKKIEQVDELYMIKAAKPLKYIMVSDEHFFTGRYFQKFKRRYETFTSRNYLVFNIKNKYKLYQYLKHRIFFIFQDIWLSILAMCVLVQLGTRYVQFVSKNIVIQDTYPYSQNSKTKILHQIKSSILA